MSKTKQGLEALLPPCPKCGGKLTIGTQIKEGPKYLHISLFAKCTKCEWSDKDQKNEVVT